MDLEEMQSRVSDGIVSIEKEFGEYRVAIENDTLRVWGRWFSTPERAFNDALDLWNEGYTL